MRTSQEAEEGNMRLLGTFLLLTSFRRTDQETHRMVPDSFLSIPFLRPAFAMFPQRWSRIPSQKQIKPQEQARSRTKELGSWMPVLLFACIFVVESTRWLGSDHTSAPLHRLFHAAFGNAIDANWTYLHHLIRKTGHFLAYGVFSVLAFRAIGITLRRLTLSALRRQQVGHTFAIAATLLAASADEWHQCFLPNRTGCVADVLLDTAGAVALQLGVVIFLHVSARWRKPFVAAASFQANSPLAA